MRRLSEEVIVSAPINIAKVNSEVEIFHGGKSASGKDFKYHDFPKLSTIQNVLVNTYRIRSSSFLEIIMARELMLLAGRKGYEMVHHFRYGGGKTFEHKPGDDLSDLTIVTEAFKKIYDEVYKQVKQHFTDQAKKGTIDYSKIKLTKIPSLSFTFGNSCSTLKAIIGGTQEIGIFLSNVSIEAIGHKVTGRIRFDIRDDFGVDDSDLYSPSLIAFWILQHERSGYRPFVNKITAHRNFIMDY